jgi:hypothetical protein
MSSIWVRYACLGAGIAGIGYYAVQNYGYGTNRLSNDLIIDLNLLIVLGVEPAMTICASFGCSAWPFAPDTSAIATSGKMPFNLAADRGH